MSGWRIAGRWCAALGWVLWITLQVVVDDPFPPAISLSQYGLGGTGWVFSVWVVGLACGPLLLHHYRPVPGPARWLLRIGFAGALVTAVVRTDEGGVQQTFTADMHMFGSVLTLVFLPLGILSALQYAARPWRVTADVLAAAAAVVGTLLLLAAAGLNTAGVGAVESWALWQGTVVIIEMTMVSGYALAVTTIAPSAGRPARAAPVQSAIQ